MQRILRDTLAWRGGLIGDELIYEPVLADAREKPIAEPAWRHWPLLVSPLEVGALVQDRTGFGVRELLGPAALYLALLGRSGGYHAVLPVRLPAVEREFDAVHRGEEGVPGYQESLGLLESAGLVERSLRSLALPRPRMPGCARLHEMGAELDRYDVTAPPGSITDRVVTLAWERVSAGLGARRYLELAEHGRLRARVYAAPANSDCPVSAARAGPMALPSLHGDLALELTDLHSARGRLRLGEIEWEAGCELGSPLLATPAEVAALLLGRCAGSNAVRRAVRATVVWLLLARTPGGAIGETGICLSALTREAAGLFGWKTRADHRSHIRQLLADLVRARLIARACETWASVRLLPCPAPPDDTIRHFVLQWSAFRGLHPDEDVSAIVRLAHEHLQGRVRGAWVSVLEERRLTIEVLGSARLMRPRSKSAGPSRSLLPMAPASRR